MGERMVAVWDPLVRIGHWLLAALFATAYLTEGEPVWLHSWAGYGIAGVVVLRVVWGFVGPEHARFAGFLRGPGAVLADLAALARGRAVPHLGHTPAGGWAIVALLACLAATTLTGMANLAAERGTGPLSPWIAQRTDAAAAAPAIETDDAEGAGEPEEADEANGSRGDGPYEELHELFANLTLALVLLHVTGVIVVSLATGENLIGAMLTGTKRAVDGAAPRVP